MSADQAVMFQLERPWWIRRQQMLAAAMHPQKAAAAEVQSGILDRRLFGRRNGRSKLANSDRPGDAPGLLRKVDILGCCEAALPRAVVQCDAQKIGRQRVNVANKPENRGQNT